MKTKNNVRGQIIRSTIVAALFLSSLLILALSLSSLGGVRQASRGQTTPELATPVSYDRIAPVSVSVIDFSKLAEEDKKAAMSRPAGERLISKEFDPPEFPSPTPSPGGTSGQKDFAGVQQPAAALPELTAQALIPSPQPSLSFLAHEDDSNPPDTMGAVGPDKLFVTLNGHYRVQDKRTGAVLSEVWGDTFWASTGATYGGDPRVIFDPYNNRWIVASLGGGAGGAAADSSILVGVSSTSNPQGTWTLFRFIVGCNPGTPGCDANGESADFPRLGFNKNWVVVAWNHTGGVQKLLILDYPAIRSGVGTHTIYTNNTYPNTFMPATTLSPTEETLYMPVQVDGGNALYRLHKITGTPSAPSVTFDEVDKVRPGGGWTGPDGGNMPQTCIGTPGVTCPTTPLFLDAGNDRVMNPIFRNGNIWYSQIVGLPANGWTHTAVQWTKINTTGAFVDGGRVEDPTATSSNGGEWYSQPSIAINKNNDVLLGFSNFSSTHFANAGYAFRFGTDAAGTMRAPIIFKKGEDYYYKSNRWGDYSHTVVDPTNDLDMWTIQEYAGTRVNQTAEQSNESSKWGTWWAKVSLPKNETETLTVQALSGATHSVVSDVNLSGGAGTVLNAKAAGPYVTYSVPVAGAGTYKVRVGVKTGINRGIFQLSIGGNNVGSIQDEYSATIGYSVRDLGTATFTRAGNQPFKFLVTGKNVSSGGYSLVFDYIELEPTNRREAEALKVQAISPVPAGFTGTWYGLFNNVSASAGSAVAFNANAVGNYVTYTVHVAIAGTYHVQVGVQTRASKGIFQLAINGVNQGSPQDEYSPTITYGMRDLGTVTLSSGPQAFKFYVTGKNPSSSKYNLVFDYIDLVP